MSGDLDRSWVRRPFVEQPSFGVSVPSVWKESVVSFTRSARTKTHGGFTGATPVGYLTCRAHVQIDNEPAGPYALEGGVVQRRLLRVFMAYPAVGDRDVVSWDGTSLPQKGDYVSWTDPAGTNYTLNVRVVVDPNNIHSFLQVETELFE